MKTSKELLPEWGQGVTDDPRLKLIYADAHAFLKNTEETYDVIIMDIADPIEAGPGYVLYTQVSHASCRERSLPDRRSCSYRQGCVCVDQTTSKFVMSARFENMRSVDPARAYCEDCAQRYVHNTMFSEGCTLFVEPYYISSESSRRKPQRCATWP